MRVTGRDTPYLCTTCDDTGLLRDPAHDTVAVAATRGGRALMKAASTNKVFSNDVAFEWQSGDQAKADQLACRQSNITDLG